MSTMDMPRIKFASSEKLPMGWWPASTGLVAEYGDFRRRGLASPAARHLGRIARDATTADLNRQTVIEAMQCLKSFTSSSRLSVPIVYGMAYSQLAAAEKNNLRILAYQKGLRSLHRGNRSRVVEILINPSYDPIESSGGERIHEVSCSAPGIGIRITRWNKIWLHVLGQRDRLVSGPDAIILQRAIDYLDGVLPVEVIKSLGEPLYYVPPEWEAQFFGDEFALDWPIFPYAQYDAMRKGKYNLDAYVRPRRK